MVVRTRIGKAQVRRAQIRSQSSGQGNADRRTLHHNSASGEVLTRKVVASGAQGQADWVGQLRARELGLGRSGQMVKVRAARFRRAGIK